MKPGTVIIFLIVVAAALLAGIIMGLKYSETPVIRDIREAVSAQPYAVDSSGFVPAKIGIEGRTLSLSESCYRISFDVTDDQAFSIQRAFNKEPASRPLTHDILRDILNEFNITIVQLRIERFGDEIYYARGFVQRNAKLLDLDMRPSDTVALSLRTGSTLYINQTMLREKGDYIC